MDRYICPDCGTTFNEPYFLDRYGADYTPVCPKCENHYIDRTEPCKICGVEISEHNPYHICMKCQKEAKFKLLTFLGDLELEELEVIDDILDGMSVKEVLKNG